MQSLVSTLIRMGRRLGDRLANALPSRRNRLRRRTAAHAATAARRRHHDLTVKEVAEMRAALREALKHYPRVRRVLPALAVLERALAAGPGGLERLPLHWQHDASARLDALVGDWSSDGLKLLREHLRALCERPPARAHDTDTRHAPVLDVEVSEISLAQFFEASSMFDLDAVTPCVSPGK